GVAPPTVVMSKLFHQITRPGAREFWTNRTWLPMLRTDAPNSPMRLPLAPWHGGLEFVSNPLWMLYVFPIEIDHVKSAVRARGWEDGMKPRVGRREKLLTRLGAFGDERRAFGRKPAALDQVVYRFADEKVAAIRRPECVAAINRRTAGRGEVIR